MKMLKDERFRSSPGAHPEEVARPSRRTALALVLSMSKDTRATLIATALLLVSAAHLHASASFFTPRPIASSLVTSQPAWEHFGNLRHWQNVEDNADHLEEATRFLLHVTPFYQTSLTSNELSKHLTAGGKNELTVRGALAGAGDVSGTWLQLAGLNTAANERNKELYLNRYASTIRLKPSLERFGVGLGLHKQFNIKKLDFYLEVATHVAHARHNIGLREYNATGEATSPAEIFKFVQPLPMVALNLATMPAAGNIPAVGNPTVRVEAATSTTPLSAVQALNGANWNYGKIRNNAEREGLGDVDITLGLRLHEYLTIGLVGIVPTSPKDTGRVLFEPRLGNGSHWALGLQLDGEYAFNNENSFQSQLRYTYLFGNRQYRSFDLQSNGDWSRFLLVVRKQVAGDANPGQSFFNAEPGINYFTQKASVTPNHQLSWVNNLHLERKNMFFDFGAMVGFANAETVKLKGDFAEPLFIAGVNFANGFEVQSAPNAKISDHSNAVAGAVPINAANTNSLHFSNLSLASGTLPSQFYSSFYADIGLQESWKGMPFNLSVGLGYELNTNQQNLMCTLTFSIIV